VRYRKKTIIRITAFLLCVAALLVGAALLVHRKKALLGGAPRYGLAPTPVHVVAARRGSLEITRTYLSIVEPVRTATLSARLTSPIESVETDEGKTVRAGEPLIKLDDREISYSIEVVKAQIAQARAELAANEATVAALTDSTAFWKREAQRMKKVKASGAATESEMEATIDKSDQLAGQLKTARYKNQALKQQIKALGNRVDELNTRLGYCVISSPYDGLVTRRLVDPGDLALPGKALLVVEDRSALKLAFDVPQQDMADIREGLALRFVIHDQARQARLTHLYPSLSVDRTVRAECALKGSETKGLTCGSYVPVTVVVRKIDDAILVPANSLVECPKEKVHVFVVREGKLAHPVVTVLGRGRDDVAIEGIRSGESVVTSTFLGWANLAGGMKVEPVK